MRFTVLLMVGWLFVVAAVTRAQDPQAPARRGQVSAVPWDALLDRERLIVEQLLQAPDWPFRVFGLLRIERYEGKELTGFINSLVQDDAWQVRCFALRQADRMGIAVDPALLTNETEARVIRAALRHGVELSDEKVEEGTMRLLRTQELDQFLLGLEIAAVSNVESVRSEAQKRSATLIRRMDDTVSKLASRRLGVLLGIDQPPSTVTEWARWLREHRNRITLPTASDTRRRLNQNAVNMVAQMDFDALSRLRDYLDTLRQRELDLVIVMDTTSSMIPMIIEARAGVDELIVFLRDISHAMRLAMVAYRDHDNPPIWEGQVFTQDIGLIRQFLFGLEISGGADFPEAVLEGLTACGQLDWNPRAAKEIVLVGDAPPHEHDLYKVEGLLQSYRDNGLVVHSVHVPMEYQAGHVRGMNAAQRADADRWLIEYNRSTAELFSEIARVGGGKQTALTDAEQLVPSIMRFTIEEGWWNVFDEFYELYLSMCR